MTAAHLAEWQLFSARYGVNDRGVAPTWQKRHRDERSAAAVRFWCRCPGEGLGNGQCAQGVTQEDGLCDECRQWCVAVDNTGRYHLLADLAAAAAPEGDTTNE